MNICGINAGGTVIAQLRTAAVLARMKAVVRCAGGGCSRAGGQQQRPRQRLRHGLGRTRFGLVATDREEQCVHSRQRDPGCIAIVAVRMRVFEQKAAGR